MQDLPVRAVVSVFTCLFLVSLMTLSVAQNVAELQTASADAISQLTRSTLFQCMYVTLFFLSLQ
jgi:hypothetical protein